MWLHYRWNSMYVNAKLIANCPQFQTINSYLPDIIDLYQLSTKSNISNYKDVKLTRIDNMFNIMHLNVHSLPKKTDILKELIQSLHQKKMKLMLYYFVKWKL